MPREYEKDAKLELIEPREGLNDSQMDAVYRWINMVFSNRKVIMKVFEDNPCMGGMAKSNEASKACFDSMAKAHEEGKKRIRLYAFPKRVKVRAYYGVVLPRP